MKNKVFSKKSLCAFVVPVIVIALLASMIVATAMLSDKGNTEAKGAIGRGANGEAVAVISDQPFHYDVATRTSFIFSFEKYLAMFFGKSIIKAVNSMGVSFSQQIGNTIIDAFRRARVPAHKLLAFGAYLESSAQFINEQDQQYFLENPDNSNHLIILYLMMCTPVLELDPDTGEPVLDPDTGKPILKELVFDQDAELFDKLMADIDWQAFYKELLKETQLSSEELGRILYQFALAMSEGSENELVQELGEPGFITLFARTLVALEEISMLTSGSSLGSARMVAELLFELGTEYRSIIDKVGVENLNNLFGGVLISDLLRETDYSDDALDAIAESTNLFGYALAFTSEFFTALDNDIAYSYHAYLHQEGEGKDAAYAKTALYLASAIDKGLTYAHSVSDIDQEALAHKLAKINAHLIVVGASEADFDEIYTQEKSAIDNMFVTIDKLAEQEALAASEGLDAYLSNADRLGEVLSLADTLTSYVPQIERGVKMTTTLVGFNFLFYLISATA